MIGRDGNFDGAATSEELYANGELVSSSSTKTVGDVIITNKQNGKPLFTQTLKNQTLVVGDVFLVEKAINERSNYETVPLDVVYGIHTAEEVAELRESVGDVKFLNDELICGFMVGIGGASDTYNNVHTVVRTSQSIPTPIPFRIIDESDDTPELRAKYFMRKVANDQVYYYGKKPEDISESSSRVEVLYQDGSIVPTTPETTVTNKFAKVCTAYEFIVTGEDVREYFIKDTADESTILSRINTIGLVTGYPHIEEDGHIEFYNVRALTALNMENQELRDSSSTITFHYRYYIQ